MVHPDLMRGDDWVRCCICGALHKPTDDGEWPTLYRDVAGSWDECIKCGEENKPAVPVVDAEEPTPRENENAAAVGVPVEPKDAR